ncbi:MAG: fructose-bisphosphate aldolase class II [Saccharospirillum sp.]|nr:fructose-bisphosphate aldolase class II [Saccharospirillum sp.]
MALITLRQLLDYAAEHDFGMPAFNINNLEQIRAIMNAAQKMNSPVILQASAGARKYAGPRFLQRMTEAACEEFPEIPVCLHQDHGTSVAVCARSIQSGFSSVMMDGSLQEDGKTHADYDYNVRVTAEAARLAHACGVSVEGELGCLGSLEHPGGDHNALLTDVDEAVSFVRETGVDALAVAIGTSHGAYKFSKPPTGETLAINRIQEIHQRLPNTHLVMHGSSSVPMDLIEVINEFGGAIPETYGVPVEDIVQGIRHGVRKVNVDTDLRLAATSAIRQFLMENPAEFDPRKYLAVSIEAMQSVCEARFEAFGSAGHASQIKPIPMEKMVSRYAGSGALGLAKSK